MKLAARTESGYERNGFDLYETEPWVSRGAAAALPLRGTVWEPAAGRGAIVRILAELGFPVWATDIHDHGFDGLNAVGDFLQADLTGDGSTVRTIMTNPPFGERGKLAEAFTRHALRLMMPAGGIVAMLLRVDFDSAGTRADLFRRNPYFAGKLILTSRPQWTGERKASPKKNFAWFWWDALHRGAPQLGYLDKPRTPRTRKAARPPASPSLAA